MDKRLKDLMQGIIGKKCFELAEFLCENADENGFVFMKISELEGILRQSKPTIIKSLKFLEEKKLLKKLKNGFYQIKLEQNNDT